MLSDPYLQSCVNEYFVDSVRTGNIVAHEIGHNLGIGHDFVSIDENNNKENRTCDTDGSVCTDQGGVMDYYVTVTGWTCCSVDDWNNEIAKFPVYCLRSADGTLLLVKSLLHYYLFPLKMPRRHVMANIPGLGIIIVTEKPILKAAFGMAMIVVNTAMGAFVTEQSAIATWTPRTIVR